MADTLMAYLLERWKRQAGKPLSLNPFSNVRRAVRRECLAELERALKGDEWMTAIPTQTLRKLLSDRGHPADGSLLELAFQCRDLSYDDQQKLDALKSDPFDYTISVTAEDLENFSDVKVADFDFSDLPIPDQGLTDEQIAAIADDLFRRAK